MKTVLITGSSGYIGVHLAKMLRDKYEVHGIDLVFDSFYLYRFYQKDVRGLLSFSGRRFDAIVHLAAFVKVNESIEMPGSYYHNNLFGTMNLLRQVHCDNFIFASTGVASNPINPYALSKRCAEDVVQEYCTKEGIDFTIFRFYNVIGQDAKGPTNTDGLFYNLIQAIESKHFTLYGADYNTVDGSAIRDYIHVNEICAAIEMAIEKPANSLQNLGTGEGRSVKEIIEKFKEVNNCDFGVITTNRRSGDLERSVLDNTSRYYKKQYSFDELLKVNV